MMKYREPTCKLCSSTDIIDDRTQGHVVCNSCGTVLEEWTVYEGADYNRHSVHADAFVVDGFVKESGRAAHAAKERIRAYTDHSGIPETVANKAILMLEKVPDAGLRKPEHSWAMIMLAAEALQAPLDVQLISRRAAVPVSKLLDICDELRKHVADMMPPPVTADKETLNAVAAAIAKVIGEQDRERRTKVRMAIVRMLDGGITKKCKLTNVRPKTRANALLAHYLQRKGQLTDVEFRALECSKDGVKKAMKSLDNVEKVDQVAA